MRVGGSGSSDVPAVRLQVTEPDNLAQWTQNSASLRDSIHPSQRTVSLAAKSRRMRSGKSACSRSSPSSAMGATSNPEAQEPGPYPLRAGEHRIVCLERAAGPNGAGRNCTAVGRGRDTKCAKKDCAPPHGHLLRVECLDVIG